ncbi:MAG: hypothetical protein PUF72_05490 [Clostridiales bacterium]|nr:hypothetical protein [Clostridiales bacterium]
MKFNVKNSVGNANMIIGEEVWDETRDNYLGDYVEAENPQQAIWLCMDFLVDIMRENFPEINCMNDDAVYETAIDYDENEITVFKNGEKHQIYWNFVAEPEEQEEN